MRIFCAFICAAGVLAPSVATSSPRAEVVVTWNQRVLAIAEGEDKFLTLKGARATAMTHIAMHDALNAIRPVYTPYAYGKTASGADPIAAAAQAAYAVAVNEYPKQRAELDSELAKWLAASPAGTPREKGVALGNASAAAILARRKDDGWNTEVQYKWHPMGPGVYAEFKDHSGTPTGYVFGSGWDKARPFVLERANLFRSPPPPAISSPEYTAAYDEVKEVGRSASRTRTADQAHLAMWWKDFVESSHNRLARKLVSEGDIELWKAARLFALLNMSVVDGYISVFENKFSYNHWRPYTAIRWAANDGNAATAPDEHWDNLHHHTYAMPSYPSAHGTACAAAMVTLEDTFGEHFAFTMETAEVDSGGPLSPRSA